MQNGELARSTQRLIEMLRPEKVGTAAQTAMTWFKPLPVSSDVVKPIRFPEFPATLGRIGSLEVRLAQCRSRRSTLATSSILVAMRHDIARRPG